MATSRPKGRFDPAINAVAGFVGLATFALFVGYYLYRLPVVPLWVIIGGAVLLVAVDYVSSLGRAPEGDSAVDLDKPVDPPNP